MRVLVLFAHPVETSFGAGLHATVVETLRACGHEVDDCDLNAERFDPVMTRQDRVDYYDVPRNRGRVGPYVDRLLKEALDDLLMGDPPRRFLKRSMRLNCAPGARCDYLAHYDMDRTTPERRGQFLKTAERRFSTW